jgi:hypothetical protein
LRLAQELTAGPVPLLGKAPDSLLTLPRGLYHAGVWQKSVVVRELTGADEEALAKVPDQLAFFGSVIALGVESVGELDLASLPLTDRKQYLNQLLLGERDLLFMKVAQVAFGNEKELAFTCSRCQIEQEIMILLDQDFPPKHVENIDTTFHTYTTAAGDELEYRPAVGADQDEAFSRKGMSVAEQNTIILSRCITKRNGTMIVDPIKYVRNLGMGDRRKILDALIELQPIIELSLKTVCAACGGDQTLALGWGDIFRP